MAIMWCDSCQKNVPPQKKKFHWCLFLILCFIPVAAVIYLIVYALTTSKKCPICRQSKFLRLMHPIPRQVEYVPQPQIPQKVEHPVAVPIAKKTYCPYCGSSIPAGDFCPQCGTELKDI